MCSKLSESGKTNGAELTNSAPLVVLGEGTALDLLARDRCSSGVITDSDRGHRCL